MGDIEPRVGGGEITGAPEGTGGGILESLRRARRNAGWPALVAASAIAGFGGYLGATAYYDVYRDDAPRTCKKDRNCSNRSDVYGWGSTILILISLLLAYEAFQQRSPTPERR